LPRKAAIHQLIGRLADDGVAVLVISSDMPEIMRISDRVLTMYHGRITGEFAGGEISESNLIGGATASLRAVA
jgi:ABC-type sugar transport system ATPase subunit